MAAPPRSIDVTSCAPSVVETAIVPIIAHPTAPTIVCRIGASGRTTVSVDVTNAGSRVGDEVVQLYVRDRVSRVTRPVQELRGFQRVTLVPGQTKMVSFKLNRRDVGFYDNSGRFVVEPGTIDVYAGDSSVGGLTDSFTVKP